MYICTLYLKNNSEIHNIKYYRRSGVYKVIYTDKDVNGKYEYVIVLKNLQLVIRLGVDGNIKKEDIEKDILEICKLFKIKKYEKELYKRENEINKLNEEYNKIIVELKMKNKQLQKEIINLLHEKYNKEEV